MLFCVYLWWLIRAWILHPSWYAYLFFFFFGQECLSHSSVRSSSPSSVLTLGTKRLVHDQFLMVKPPLPYVIAQQQGQEERRGRKKKKKVRIMLSFLTFKGEISLLWGDLSGYLLSEPDIFNGSFFYQENKLFCKKASSLLLATASCMQLPNYKALT